MMAKYRNQNILLIEIMIAVLFFALCSVVLLEMFVAAREYETDSGIETKALIAVQNIAERVYAADEIENYLIDAGFSAKGDSWELYEDGFTYNVVINNEVTSVGILRSAYINVERDNCLVAQIPCTRYIPGGANE